MHRFLPLLLLFFVGFALAQKDRIPHAQDKMPGPALTPAQAIAKMKVPDGFTVELVASEPDIVNPVAMTFDERGRVWITESLEYPRRSKGPGKDRVKVIEIGKDGKASRVTVFAEGLNIPSGIAVGHGGVWVANSPDILFYKIGPDGKALGKPEVVVTGFGRTDTHELPNSLTWGPDGWLYGWNGVFNYSHVKYRGKEWKFTCAVFRIHPKTREFQIWCEGTSNPWGIAFNQNGDLFASACVIDHLWHLTETGYYIRQGGPYPPYTWPIGSIVKHRHQKAAYCGIHWFDSDAYPAKYREKLVMGNIHGGCVNVDRLQRQGSTYLGTSDPDFLTANDQWFMPVVQKTGPDGSLYILDWYDRYHCYQDANRDPKGIDRLQGRLYRIRYKDTPRVGPFDLAKESDDSLVKRLGDANVYARDIAQRLLVERQLAGNPALSAKLASVVFDSKAPRKQRMHALWSLVGGGIDEETLVKLLAHADSTFRSWGVRAAGDRGKAGERLLAKLRKLIAEEKAPDVLVQLAIANNKLGLGGMTTFLRLLAAAPGDKLLPHIVWQNMHPLLETQGVQFAQAVQKSGAVAHLGEILPRAVERLLAGKKPQTSALAGLYAACREVKAGPTAQRMLHVLTQRIVEGEASKEELESLRKDLLPQLQAPSGTFVASQRMLLQAALGDADALAAVSSLAQNRSSLSAPRLLALAILVRARSPKHLDFVLKALDEKPDTKTATGLFSLLGRIDSDAVAPAILQRYATFRAELKPRAVELLTQQPSWGKVLLQAVAAGKVPASAINVNQARRLLASKNKELVSLVKKHWGTLRTARDPAREQVVRQMKSLLSRSRGDAKKGMLVYKNLCGQCHKIHGEGVEVGPDITSNGRASFDQLLSNVFDPSLVVGPGYHAVTVLDNRGRTLTGLLTESGDKRVVLKVQGGKLETIPRSRIVKMETSKLSMMPEGVEKQFKPQEVADLFAFLCLEKHPSDKKAGHIPGTPRGLTGR